MLRRLSLETPRMEADEPADGGADRRAADRPAVDEATLIRTSAQLEHARPWTGRRPPADGTAD
jgi:hypothetical protein